MSISGNYVLVLSSGGIDSTACIRFFKKLKFNVEAIFFDYGQLANKNEYKSIVAITKHYKITLRTVKIKMDTKFLNGLVPGRNALLYFSGLMNFRFKNGIIASGIHAGTPYYDCSPDFLNDTQRIFDGYSNGAIKASAPFLNFTKKEIFDYCYKEKVPLNLTYSCELGKKNPCGICSTCKDIEKIYAIQKYSN